MLDVVALLVSAAVAALIAPGMLRSLPTRPNWLGRELSFPAGAVAAVATILSLGGLAAVQEAGPDVLAPEFVAVFGALDEFVPPLGVWDLAVVLLGVAFLGLVDDLLGGDSRGWRGHAHAALRGELPTGLLKALGTVALATLVLAGRPDWALSVLLVALTTNLFNILDLRPGRAMKVFVVLGVALAAAGYWERELGAFVGPLLVLGLYDLRMRAMLGDTGSNLVGAVAGLWLVMAFEATGQAIALGIVVALTVFGEVRSITRTIESIPPLRWLDELGRPQDAASS